MSSWVFDVGVTESSFVNKMSRRFRRFMYHNINEPKNKTIYQNINEPENNDVNETHNNITMLMDKRITSRYYWTTE